MAFNFSPKIITDGLVLHLDAANPKSYMSGSTTWNDLSRNGNNGTLVNGVGFNSANNGSMVFDGVNDYVQTLSNFTVSAMTLIGFIKRNGSQRNYTGIFFSRGTNITGLNVFSTQNILGYHWNGAAYTYNSNLLIPDNTWCMVAMAVSSTAATFYVNTSSATNNVSHGTTTIDNFKIGQDDFGGRFYNGTVGNMFLYNRALTPQEILQNFNATRSRYGV